MSSYVARVNPYTGVSHCRLIMNALDILTRTFPGRLFIPLVDAAVAIGYAPGTGYNMHWKGTFPIRVQKQGSKPVVSIIDLANYINAKSQPPTEPPKRRRGRPTKAEQIAARGLSINQASQPT